MWKIIAAEIRYHKTVIIATYSLGALFLLGTLFSHTLKNLDSPTATWSWMSVITSAYIFLLIYIGSYNEKERRERRHALLPIPLPKLGMARIALIVLLQAGFGGIWLIGVLAAGKGRDPAFLYFLFSAYAFFLLTVALFAIYMDLGHFGSTAHRWVLFGLLIALAITILWLTVADEIIHWLDYIFKPEATPGSAAILAAITAGLFCLDVMIYARRKSYLE